ncbi:MAG: hypothetical protein MAG795_01067 [Candidatus Woesearchaeota archaeon]|nr:hypothetical protein [Candidatus Woesearchaeota archaeon]
MVRGFIDKAQTEYWISKLFMTDTEIPITREARRQFIIKAPIFMFLVFLLRFFVMDKFPNLFFFFAIILFLYPITYIFTKYLWFFNKKTKSLSMVTILLGSIPLFILILTL